MCVTKAWVHQNYTGYNTWPKIAYSKVSNWLCMFYLAIQSKLLSRITQAPYKKTPLVFVGFIVPVSYSQRYYVTNMHYRDFHAWNNHEVKRRLGCANRYNLARDVPNSPGQEHVGGLRERRKSSDPSTRWIRSSRNREDVSTSWYRYIVVAERIVQSRRLQNRKTRYAYDANVICGTR